MCLIGERELQPAQTALDSTPQGRPAARVHDGAPGCACSRWSPRPCVFTMKPPAVHVPDGAPAVVLAVVFAVAVAAVAPAGLLVLAVAPASPLAPSLRRHLELPLGRLQSADIYQKEYVRQSHPSPRLVQNKPLASREPALVSRLAADERPMLAA